MEKNHDAIAHKLGRTSKGTEESTATIIMCGPTNYKRILAVYGTEMGSTKTEAKKMIESWESKEKLCVTFLEGNKAADGFDDITTENYDVLVIFTSSYGDGDAPSGFGRFLYKLYAAGEAGTNTLSGLEHSVLGFGSTAYYTFQNVPRLCDRLLGESGSRRFLMRAEVDEMDDLQDNNAKIQAWSDAVLKHCKETTDKKKEPVCAWTSPKDEVYEKKLGPDGYELGSGPSESTGGIAIVSVGVAIVAYCAYTRFYRSEEL